MAPRYLGHLSPQDPMHGYLRSGVLPLLQEAPKDAGFRVFSARGTYEVYLYEEIHSGVRVVGKFFGGRKSPGGVIPHLTMAKELLALSTLRGYGFVGYPHHV